MSNVTSLSAKRHTTTRHLKNQRIGKWLTKLASYLQHSREFREANETIKAEFWAELVQVMAEADIPDIAWNIDAIRYCRRRFKFFPCAAELCETLNEYAAPIRAAALEEWKKQQTQKMMTSAEGRAFSAMSPMDHLWLAYFRRHAESNFQHLATERGTNCTEARHAALSLLRQQSRAAYKALHDDERLTHENLWHCKGAVS